DDCGSGRWCAVIYSVLELDVALFYFFFSSRRRHTRLVSDWSSDVCSSDLRTSIPLHGADRRDGDGGPAAAHGRQLTAMPRLSPRSEERRVGKECRSRWSPYH